MNFRNRLKNLETRMIGNNFGFCNCVKEIETVLILPKLEGEPVADSPEDFYVPEFCEICEKRNADAFECTFIIAPKNKDEH